MKSSKKVDLYGRGVGSVIGAAFLLLILLSGYTSYIIYVKEVSAHNKTLQEMQELDRQGGIEDIDFSAAITSKNKLNLTISNTGSVHCHLIWLGVLNKSASPNSQEHHEISVYINPAETVYNVTEANITITDNDSFVIQLVSELGNLYQFNYPEATSALNVYDFIDELTGGSPLGVHSLFSAQQLGPDGVCDIMSEAPQTPNTTLINQESFEDGWSPSGWSEVPSDSRWNKENNRAHDGTFSADFDGRGSGDLETGGMDCSDAGAIYVDFWYWDENCEAAEFLLEYFDGTSWDAISDLGATASEDQWLHYTEKVTDAQYLHSAFQIRWSVVSMGNSEHAYVDLVEVVKGVAQTEYGFNYEEQWTDADYSQQNEWLSMYGGSMGNESLVVDVWNGTGWTNVIASLQSGWNSVDVSSYLDSSTFKIRFRDEGLASDTTQDSWEIDTVFLNVWT